MALVKLPDIRTRLRHNVLPLNIEKQAILDSIVVAQAQLASFRFQQTDEEAISLRAYIANYSSLLSPMRRLPVEILQKIFLHPDIHDFEKTTSTTTPPFSITDVYQPGVLASVSCRWRDIVCGTPKLWSSFTVILWRAKYSLERLRLCLQRSNNMRLTIAFDWRKHNSLQPLHYTALAEVLAHSHRWAHIAVPVHSQFLALLSPARGRLPSLETIAFYNSSDSDYNPEALVDVFENAPALRTLSLHKVCPGPQVLVLWHQLRQVSIHFPRHDEMCRYILDMTSNIRHLTLESRNSGPDPSIPPPPNLMLDGILLLGDESRTYAIQQILRHINSPALKEIRLIHGGVEDASSITSFIERSGCFLERLVLQQVHIRPRELLALFSSIPTLRTLVITDSTPNAITNAVVDALTPSFTGGTAAVLPALTTLVIIGTYMFCASKLLAMLESRRLETVDLTLLNHKFTTPDIERFKALDGLNFGRLVCDDEEQKSVKIQFGTGEQPDWAYSYFLLQYGAGNPTTRPNVHGLG
ncbi:hypothetical protein B0H16DRAFT_1711353 [Mycena metata]|uniref:F-box domain-containing protein n=1 Tax=Mycena metata TaxID=1033252 RepID=A0AAD7K7X4_9AGAR|nr:hypothetical protein B0H16DRAFT_1711353 [Mycena metata]